MAGEEFVLDPINAKLAIVTDVVLRYSLKLLGVLVYRSNSSWAEMGRLKRAEILEYARICNRGRLINWAV